MDNSAQISISDDLLTKKKIPSNLLTNNTINHLMVNDMFFDFFGLNQKYKDLIKYKGDAILGYEFKKYFKVGDHIKDDGEDFEVKGFLEKDEFFVNPFQKNGTTKLNEFMITSFTIPKNRSSLDYIGFLENSLVLPKNNIKANELVDNINKTNLKYISIEKISDEIAESRSDIYNAFITVMVVATLILFFSSVTLITNIIQYIKDNLKDFAVNMICGASCRDLKFRVGLQIMFMESIALIVLLIVFGLDISVLIASLVLVLYGVVAMIYPVNIFNREQIVNIMRKN